VSALQPHRKRYWLTPPPDDPAKLAEQICTVCEVYEATPALAAQGAHVMSTDEMTGIQALERQHPSLPMQPGHVEHQEFEYQRHGTQSLIANLDVATGQVVTPSIGPTRDLCRLRRSYHPDHPDRSRGCVDLHHRSAQHSSVRSAGTPGGCALWHPGGSRPQRQKRPSRHDEDACRLSLRPEPSYWLCVHSQA
jgi:hypothetical protein